MINTISKEDFLKINEDNVMFITNPGRMGDEDGSTFIIKEGSKYIIYRLSGWMYPSDLKDIITLEDTKKQFPKWFETWENSNDENYHGKYKYIYMGYGNGLCVDNRIYDDFKPFLDEKVNGYLSDKEDKESLKYVAIYMVWEDAFNNMIEKEDN